MANVTRDLAFSKSAYANQASPNTATVPSSGSWYILGYDSNYKDRNMYLGGLASWPSSLKRNRIISAKIRYQVTAGDMYIEFETVNGGFTPSAVTWNKRPSSSNDDGHGIEFLDGLGISAGYTGDIWIDVQSRTTTLAEGAIGVIKEGGVEITGANFNGASGWRGKSVLSDGSAPYLRVTYSNSTIITSKVVIGTKLASTVNPETAQKVTWSLKKDSSYYCYNETWTQASAKFYWKVSDASSWNVINISGSTMSVTIPAFTFPTGKTIQYYIQATDTDGTTTNTPTYTSTVPASKITPQNSPTSGYVNPRNPVTFSWYFAHTNGNYPQQSAKLCWRVAGASSWNEVPADGTTQNVTIPAYPAEGSFPIASTIQWYLYGVDSSGSASQSATYSFSTTAATSYATAVSPSGNVEDGSAPITFRWMLTSADGLQMSQVDLWWKLPTEDNNSWHVIVNSTEIISEYTVPGGYFPAGEIEWLVHAYNIDGTRGPDSQTSFICVNAPDPVAALSATPLPITTISWQSEGQEAYEVSIDGAVVRKAYGVGVYSWTVPEPLEDGEHMISVRIQGIYGLWSQPSETSIFVQNVPELDHLGLSGEFGVDAVLTVDGTGLEELPVLHWYRDGELIGQTTGTLTFTDRRSLGRHAYRAEVWHESGNYTRSNAVTGETAVVSTMIAPLSGGEWLDLRLSENSDSVQEFSWSKTTARIHVTGAVYPVLESSPYEDLSGTYSCSFPDPEGARAFEALRGQVVIVKSRRGQVVTGALAQLQKTVRLFFTTFRFQIQQIDWEDFVNYDEGD